MSKRKQSAVQREFNIVIVLNNEEVESEKSKKKSKKIPKKKEIEMTVFNKLERESHRESESEPIYTLEGKIVSKGGGVEDIKRNLDKNDGNFSIKYRMNETETDTDIFTKIAKYLYTSGFCKLGSRYIYTSLDESDFVIFINDGMSNSVYTPLCIAFIKIYKKGDNNFLYISTICADKKFGQCGKFLMNTIKYVATLLNCNEIRLESVSNKKAKQFYKENGFVDINDSPVDYDHFYYTLQEDSVYKPPSAIPGKASIAWHERIKMGGEQIEGGKYKRKQRTKKNIMNRRTKRKGHTL